MKIFCIGRNYAQHAKELNNPVPESPVVFMKAPTALLKPGQNFYYPKFSENIHFEGELVLKIGKNGKSIQEKFAHKYIHSFSLGIDFTARDLQKNLKEKGLPWELAKAFDGAAPVGKFIPFNNLETLTSGKFQIFKNNSTVQEGQASEMLFSIPNIIAFISTYFTLQQGDLIYTGTPAGVGPVEIGDVLTGHFQGDELLRVEVK
jgi:2-keto-4-pentenoate hydratase/2-oxohepta-3-ene-1,7-dioic acid hydratase in catechol pathway